MTLVLNPTKQIAFDDLVAGRLEGHNIAVVAGSEAEPIVYLCAAGAVLRVCQDDNGICYFVIPENSDIPWLIFNAIMQEFDCTIERMVDDRGRVVTSFGTQAVIDFLGQDHIEQGDLISHIDGGCPDLQPGSVLCEQAEIARALVDRHPQLHEDTQTLLLLVEDIYGQRHPPFRVTLQKKSPVVAQLLADAILAWAQNKPHASDLSEAAHVGEAGARYSTKVSA